MSDVIVFDFLRAAVTDLTAPPERPRPAEAEPTA
jgi:hypothetical protein